jgi:hypothetical protein
MEFTARCRAYIDDEQAVSTVRLKAELALISRPKLGGTKAEEVFKNGKLTWALED